MVTSKALSQPLLDSYLKSYLTIKDSVINNCEPEVLPTLFLNTLNP